MKTMTHSLKMLFAVLLAVLVYGCKKDKDDVKKPSCRIITATPTPSSAGDPFSISYNEDGKISSLTQGTNVTSFLYSGNNAIATQMTGGTFSLRKIITINSDGLASNVKTEYDQAGTNWNNEAYDYSGTELVKATTTSSSGGAPTIAILTWSDGNLISLTSGSNVTTIDYFTDKKAQMGDYLDLAQLVAGYKIYRTKNMIKSIFSGSSITTFSYNFDGEGKITSMDLGGAGTGSYAYQHQCN